MAGRKTEKGMCNDAVQIFKEFSDHGCLDT
jgi:hypothetical protein